MNYAYNLSNALTGYAVTDLKIYNACNHPITLWSEEDCRMDRSGKYVLKENNSAYYLDKIEQQIPLNVREGAPKKFNINEKLFCFPSCELSEIDSLPNATQYDIIVVSSRYASVARAQIYRERLMTPASPNLDFLDRLVTTIPVFKNENDRKPTGAISFEKVCCFRNIFEYSNLIAQGESPSVVAILYAIDAFQKFGQQTNESMMAIQILMNYINQRRGFAKIFNV